MSRFTPPLPFVTQRSPEITSKIKPIGKSEIQISNKVQPSGKSPNAKTRPNLKNDRITTIL